MKNIDFNIINNRYGTYCTQWDYVKDRFGVEGLVPFTISDTDFNVPDEIIETIEKRTKHHIFGYSRWNHDDFKYSVVNWYKKRFNTIINPQNIVYSPSVTFSIAKLIEMLTNEEDCILIQNPSYDAFFKTIEGNNRKIIKSELKLINNHFEVDFLDMEKKIENNNIKVFLLCNPHNPTGRVWTKKELIKMIEICKKHNVFIISDDIHMDIVYKDNEFTPIIEICDDYKENIAIVTSATKTFNTPALTFSYCIIPSNDIMDKFLFMLKNKNGLSSPNIYGLLTTITAYEKCDYWVKQLTDYLESNLNYIEDELKNIKEVELIRPEGTYLALIKFSDKEINEDDFIKRLMDNGVAIMGGSIYGIKGSLRLNFAAPREKISKAITAIKNSII